MKLSQMLLAIAFGGFGITQLAWPKMCSEKTEGIAKVILIVGYTIFTVALIAYWVEKSKGSV